MVIARRLLASLLALAGAASLGACDLILRAGHDRHIDDTIDCSSGRCECKAGLDSCDGDEDNGCETDITSDPKNCGACGNDCANGVCNAGACACAPGFEDCDHSGSNGCEAELVKDDNNCGACGHYCAGAPCVNGVCQTVTLAGLDGAVDLAVADGFVFVARCGDPPVAYTSANGGTVSAVGSDTGCASLVAATAADVFWAAGSALSTAKTSFPPTGTLLDAGASASKHLAANATHVYWWSDNAVDMTQSLLRIAVSGGSAEQIVSGAITALTADADGAYWADATGLHSVGSDGALITDLGSIEAVALAVSGDMIAASTGTSIQLVPKLGGAATELVQTKDARAVAMDDAFVYWAEIGNSTVRRIGRDGSGETALAGGETFATNTPFAIDERAVYWIAKQKVRKVAK